MDSHQAINDDNRLIGSPRITSNIGVDMSLATDIILSTQLRYFTQQPTEVTNDGGKTFKFEETNNQFYLDSSLMFEDVMFEHLDVRLSGKNLLDNRDSVGGPWLRGS